jgi:simple sugar transport system ATP-binding protein
MTEKAPILVMENITKRFPGILAIDNVNFGVMSGEIHGLLGQNGAGKTTLMKILYGLYKRDGGRILFDSQIVCIDSPADAKRLGIGMVEQEPQLVPTMPVWKNIVIGNEPTRKYVINGRKARNEIKNLQGKYGLEIDLDSEPAHLSAGAKKATQILKALYQHPKILILDEPTTFLTEFEKQKLIKALRGMTAEKEISVVFITHKLHEVKEVTDRVTVLRNGKAIDTVESGEASIQDLVRLMIERDILFKEEKKRPKKEEKVFEVKGLRATDEDGKDLLKDVSFSVHKGEIFGIVGVSGNGQKELLEVLMGQRKAESGRMFYRGKEWTKDLRNEAAYIPESHEDSIVAGCSVVENLILGVHRRAPVAFSGVFPSSFGNILINTKEAVEYAERLVAQYGVKASSLDVDADTLSGGNKQRLVLARELSRSPDFIIANNPTAGLDVESQELIRRVLIDEAEKHKGILLISGDLDETMLMSDEIGVMYEGVINGILSREEATKDKIGRMMGGDVW